jgi:hypothetical protein
VNLPYNYIDDHPGFVARNKRSIWVYKLDEDFEYLLPYKGSSLKARWLAIHPDGRMIIPKGYAWDGCTPKFSLFDLAIIGTPDGMIDVKSGKPKTHDASLIHDALYQYYLWHELTEENIDRLFYQILREQKFKLAWIYYQSVRLFGRLASRVKHPDRAQMLAQVKALP